MSQQKEGGQNTQQEEDHGSDSTGLFGHPQAERGRQDSVWREEDRFAGHTWCAFLSPSNTF